MKFITLTQTWHSSNEAVITNVVINAVHIAAFRDNWILLSSGEYQTVNETANEIMKKLESMIDEVAVSS